jgi:hypothetical protein
MPTPRWCAGCRRWIAFDRWQQEEFKQWKADIEAGLVTVTEAVTEIHRSQCEEEGPMAEFPMLAFSQALSEAGLEINLALEALPRALEDHEASSTELYELYCRLRHIQFQLQALWTPQMEAQRKREAGRMARELSQGPKIRRSNTGQP